MNQINRVAHIIFLSWVSKIEYITTKQAEIYYWFAFLVANTPDTAAGD